MAKTTKVVDVKVQLKLTKGSQTIPNLSADADDQALYNTGIAVAKVVKEEVDTLSKIETREVVEA